MTRLHPELTQQSAILMQETAILAQEFQSAREFWLLQVDDFHHQKELVTKSPRDYGAPPRDRTGSRG
ncbi:hypothetical protein J2X72_002688 [Phyllobacterium sp. 1468]|uniref:hypothetical protein n=1 Tax=Phyllobacterium sp. 1468 TaxID=2817759 RepID=UPI002858C6B0|nr:hypothetical protein [Phyllobacterium sp. 1468]MDR6633888.1 hypothetical protein [Phyllobacterium sp. 1468]